MSDNIYKSHNVSNLMSHFVCPAKYRRVVVDEEVDRVLQEVCRGIEERYDIRFLKIGTVRDYVHFLIQSVLTMSTTEIIRTMNSITAKRDLKECPKVKKKLWGG